MRDTQKAFHLIGNVYQSMNIYHAIYIIENTPSDFDADLINMMHLHEYPLVYWQKNLDFITKARIIIIPFQNVSELNDIMDLFTLVITSKSYIYDSILQNEQYQSLTMLNFSSV
jgi:hypothetical protein